MMCQVLTNGHVEKCTVINETPEGFGVAGIQLSAFFKMKPTTSDGRSVGGAIVAIPIRFLPS